MSRRVAVSAVVITMVATACATVERRGTRPLAPRLDRTVSAQSASTSSNAQAVTGGWLPRFGDDGLEALVAEALAHSFAIDELESTLGRSRALARRAQAAMVPRLDAFAAVSAEGTGTGDANGLVRVRLAASWEPDLFGRLRHASTADALNAEALAGDLESARRVVAGAVAEAYFVAAAAIQLADVARRNEELLRETLGFVETQYERGLRSGQDIALIRADVSASAAALAQAERAVRDAKRAVEVLCGRLPTAEVSIASEPPDVPTLRGTVISAALLERRPDLAAAAKRVEATRADRSAARADGLLTPRIGIAGSIALEGSSPDDVTDAASVIWRLGAEVTVPLYDAGARSGAIDEATAAVGEATARYNAAALEAFEEVEDAVDLGRELRGREAALRTALAGARKALKFARFRYESGDSDLLDVLSIQQRVASVESQLVDTKRARLVHYVALALALGGEVPSGRERD